MSGDPDLADRLDAYAGFFARLQPDRLDRLGDYFAPRARFKDPFNDVRGLDQIRRVFLHMYATLEEPRFRVQGFALSDDTGYIHWTFEFRTKGWLKGLAAIDGMSRVRFDAEARVCEHIDYWDAGEQVYQRLPLIGGIFRLVRNLFSAG